MSSVSSVNVSSVTSSYDASGSGSVASLQKQLTTLQKELSAETTSSDDAKTKEIKSAALSLQIQLVETQIQQIQQKNAEASKGGKENSVQAIQAQAAKEGKAGATASEKAKAAEGANGASDSGSGSETTSDSGLSVASGSNTLDVLA